METKKRHVSDDSEVSLPKKRAIADAHGSPTPHTNGSITTDEPKDANIEHFRKEAIYRRMQHYSRECERGQTRIAELERLQRSCESGIAALEACWTQLLDTTKSLMRPEDTSHIHLQTADIFDLSTHASDPDSSLATALRGKLGATKELLTSLVQRGAAPLLQDQVFLTAQAAQAECTTLRAELALLRTRLARADADTERVRDELIAAEKRADRARSTTVAHMNGSSIHKPEPDADSALKPDPDAIPAIPPPLMPSVSEQVNGLLSQPAADWQAIADLRGQKIAELDARLKEAHGEIKTLIVETEMPSDSRVKASAPYIILNERAARLEHEASQSTSRFEALDAELRGLRSTRTQYEESVLAEASKAVQDLKALVEKRDKDLVRLREQRDQQMAELNERKQKDGVKHASLEELKALAESRSERISVLQSEAVRLKSQLAANAGHEALLSFFMQGKDGDASFVDDLQTRLAASESRTAALEVTLQVLDASAPDAAAHCRAEAEARAQLAEATVQLERCRAVLGDLSTMPPDAAQLTTQLQAKEEEVRTLRMQVEQHAQAETASYAELDRLSAAWEALDKQVKSKVFDLKAMEDRVLKAGSDRAKLENKFFAAMRDKEAVENERKNLARNAEKQTKVIEKLTAVERSLQAQLVEHDKTVEAYEQAQASLKTVLTGLTDDVTKWRTRAEEMKSRHSALSKAPCKGCHDLSVQTAKAQQLQEDAIRMKDKAEKLLAKAKAAPAAAAPKTSREQQLQSEVDKCMSILKCSTCKMRMRNTVITKCMHSFCKECVDARITTRQRKCPACNLAFGQADVQQLFFQ